MVSLCDLDYIYNLMGLVDFLSLCFLNFFIALQKYSGSFHYYFYNVVKQQRITYSRHPRKWELLSLNLSPLSAPRQHAYQHVSPEFLAQ